ncbi:MAG: DUF3781 domain-containing protein [Sphaerochaetaceae bacterium]
MEFDKKEILSRLCYTDLVYGRIRKKLGMHIPNDEIEHFIYALIAETAREHVQIIGKNYYVHNKAKGIRITINRNTYRIITVDRMK